MRVLIVIPTYEPHYIHHPGLERFYTDNFDSFLSPQGYPDVKLVLTDFASSKSYKAFLRNYVRNRQDCYLIDGEQEAARQVAENIALRMFDYDYVALGACDLRARDANWLEILLRDFDDPKVQIVVPTVTADGEFSSEQSQVGPIERESRTVGIREKFNYHLPVFSRRFFQPFDNRYPDIFDWHHGEYGVMYQLAARGYIAKINFRVNLVHGDQEMLPLKPGNNPIGWGSRNDLYEVDEQRFLNRLSHLLYFLPTKGHSFTAKIRTHLVSLKAQGWRRYFYFRFFSTLAFEDFRKLDLPTKEAMMRALFYRPLSDYERYSYTIYGSGSHDADATVSSATPVTKRS